MRKGDGTKGWLAGESCINLPGDTRRQRMFVLACELHDEVVRVLAVVDRIPLAHFAAGEQAQVAAAGNREWLQARHCAEPDASATSRPTQHEHPPVHAATLGGTGTAGAVNVTRFVDELTK